jgi:AcrR family transcriptional regulator
MDAGAETEPLEPSPDGRVRRRERNRVAIVDALAEILGEGDLEPTAERVAARAGVQVRTLFRHFPDMASLHAEIAGRLRAEVIPVLAAVPTAGDARLRLDRLVAARAATFERVGPFRRAGNVLRWRLAFVAEHHARIGRDLRRHLLTVLPELREVTPAALAALDAAISFESWDRLRTEQRLGVERAREAMAYAALAILERALGDRTDDEATRPRRRRGEVRS